MVNALVHYQNLPASGLSSYLAWVAEQPVLSHDDEIELANRMLHNQDVDAVKQLILSNLRHVVYIARQYKGYGLPVSDLIQEGNVGLIKAVKRFDPAQGVRLVTYAIYWIKSEIHEFVLRNWSIVKVATTKVQRMLFFKLRSLLNFDTAISDKDAKAIADSLGVTKQDIIDMQKRLQYDHSIDYSPDDSHAIDLSDRIPALTSNETEAIEANADAQTIHNSLFEALSQLPDRLAEVIRLRFLNDEKTTLQVIAKKLGVSIERVRQLETQAIQFLRQKMPAE
jgi:RNA polymerase sigma-32 factor|tara:strand:+ start:10709 stop:11551 length:843 start_codon:yes stop_codon:yes gene_type:complete